MREGLQASWMGTLSQSMSHDAAQGRKLTLCGQDAEIACGQYVEDPCGQNVETPGDQDVDGLNGWDAEDACGQDVEGPCGQRVAGPLADHMRSSWAEERVKPSGPASAPPYLT